MADPGLKVVVACGVAAGLLIALHFAGGGPDEVAMKVERAPRAKSSEDGAARDRAKWEDWKNKFQPNASDTRQERDEKSLAITMQAFRAQPVEIVDRPGSKTGGIEIQQPADIERVLAEGGTYSGPLPPELEGKSGGQK